MGKYPRKRLAGLVKMDKLASGETTVAMRVRGSAEVIAWASKLTPLERGELLRQAYASSTPPSKSEPTKQKRKRKAEGV